MAVGLFLEIELFDRDRLGAVWLARQHAWHAEPDIARILRIAQRAPTGIVGRIEYLAQIARIGQFRPRVHSQQRRRSAGNERTMRGRGDLAEIAQQSDVDGRLIEMIVADQAAIGLTAQLPELRLVELLEKRALVPFRIGIIAQIAIELVLRDVHDLELQGRVGLGIASQIIETAPRALDALEFRRMHDGIDLVGELLVETGDHLVDRVEHVFLDEARIGQRLLHQRIDRVLDLGRRALASRLEGLLQERREFVGLLVVRLRESLSFPAERSVAISLLSVRRLRWVKSAANYSSAILPSSSAPALAIAS